MRASREVWAKRVQRWRESDLTAAEFAAETGINPRTLSYWKWRLGKDERDAKLGRSKAKRSRPKPKARKEPPTAATLVEVTPPASTWWRATERIEVVIDERLVVRVPDTFEVETLRRVVGALRSAEEGP